MCNTTETHPDYQYELKLIQKVQQKRLFEAERNRHMQIKNINALHAFEVENIEAEMKVRLSFAIVGKML